MKVKNFNYKNRKKLTNSTDITFNVINNIEDDTRNFIKKWHYSNSVSRLTKYVFKFYQKNKLIGVAQYGSPTGMHCQNKYSVNGLEVLELKRFCLIDRTPKNMESFLIGKTLRYLKKNTKVGSILSYSDLEQKHQGTIYKATNFKFLGQTQRNKACLYKGQKYHTRRVYQKGTKTSAMLLNALTKNKAKLIKIEPKNIYLYDLRKK